MLLRICGPLFMGRARVEDPLVIHADLPRGWAPCSGLRHDLVEGNGGSRVIMDLLLDHIVEHLALAIEIHHL